MSALRLLGAAFAKFWRDRGLFLASGIAFQVLLCLVPFTLLVLSFAGSYLFSHERVLEQFGRSLEQAAPALDADLRGHLLEIVDHRRTSGLVGTIALLWIATALFGALRMALNTIFGVPRDRGALHGIGFDLGMIALSGALFTLSIGLTTAVEYLRRAPFPLLRAVTKPLLGFALSHVLPFLFVLVTCFLIYHLVPNRRGSARASLLGALFTSVLWDAAKRFFAWYVAAAGGYSLVYGSLSAVAALLVWTYYSAAVLLLGAEVAALIENRPAQKLSLR